jgi:Fe-S cluster assembly protein SufD
MRQVSEMATNMRLADRWANSVRASVAGSGPPWLQALRGAAAQAFLSTGLPGNKDEAWKYTSLRRLEDIHPALGPGALAGTSAAWPPAVAATADFGFRVHAGRVVGLDICSRQGVTVMHLDQALMQSPSPLLDRLRCLLEKADVHGRGRAFEALNTAMLEHGVVVHVAAGVDAGRCLAQWAQGGGGPSRLDNFRLVLMLEPGARLSLVEHYQGLEDPEGEGHTSAHALNLVLQIELSAGAVLHHVMLQNEAARNVLLTSGEVDQGEGSSYRFTGFDLGGSLVRHAITCRLAGAAASVTLNGAFLTSGSSHVDYHVCADHQAPGCSSEQFFRGVLGGHSRGVFNGKALIRRGADGSKVRQSNANLLLSAFAEIDTKPELEIYADEVEASHGATVGQLDEQAVFYLRSRGLDEAEARRMLTSAFCRTVTARLNDAVLEAQVNRMLEASMPQLDLAGKVTQ